MGRSRRDPQNEQNTKKSIGLISIRLDFGLTFEAGTKTRSAAVLAGPGAAVGTLKLATYQEEHWFYKHSAPFWGPFWAGAGAASRNRILFTSIVFFTPIILFTPV